MNFNTAMQQINSASVIIFFAIFSLGAYATVVLKPLVRNTAKHWYLKTTLISIIYGISFVVINFLMPNCPMPVIIILAPLFATLSFFIYAREKFYVYIFIFLIILCNYSCFYIFSAGIFSFIPRYDIRIRSFHHQFAILVITSFFLLIYLTVLLLIGKSFLNKMRAIIRSLRRGIMYMFYMIILNTQNVLLSFFILPRLQTMFVANATRNALATFVFIYSMLTLISSYLIIIIQSALERNLELERMYRTSSQANSILSYSFNATKGTLETGKKIFSPVLWSGTNNYFTMIGNFIRECVHPDNHQRLLEIGKNTESLKYSLGTSFSVRARVAPDKICKYVNMNPKTLERLNSWGKEWFWVEVTITVTQDQITNDMILYVTVNDIDDAVTYENILKKTAQLDPLTGIYNRGELEARVSRFLQNEDAKGALFIMDLDSFKSVNDNLGHTTGDTLLKETASMLGIVFQSEDIVARLGGDEFCIFATGIDARNVLEKRASEICKRSITEFKTKDGKEIKTSASIGIALAPGDGKTFDELYQHADTALYASKESGKNTWRFYADTAK